MSDKKEKIKLKIDTDECIMCGTCALAYEDYFSINDDGTINDSKALVPEDQSDEIKMICPVGAIEEDKLDNSKESTKQPQ